MPHAPSISPDVLNTFSRLFVLTDVAAQRVHQGFQATFVKLVTTCIDPCLALGPVSINDLSHFAEMFFGMKAIENLSGWREQFGSRVPNPGRAIAQTHLTQGFGETAAAGLALYARGKIRQVGAGIRSGGAFQRTRIADRSWIAHGFAFPISRFRRPDRDRKSTRLNSSHGYISYDVFCLPK